MSDDLRLVIDDDGFANIPASACRADTGRIAIATNDDGEHTLTIQALSGIPWVSWFFGLQVFDLDGMKVKDKVIADYCHSRDEIVGFIDTFEKKEGGALILSGLLTPFHKLDRASEISAKGRAGVPYEGSIEWAPSFEDDWRVEILEQGQSAEVNGITVDGPITIWREWPLRAVAVCPLGADRGTQTMVASDHDEKEVKLKMKDKNKAKTDDSKNATADDKGKPSTDAKAGDDGKPNTQSDAKTGGSKDAPNPDKSTASADNVRSEFAAYCDEFGEAKAAEFFKAGMGLGDARKAYASAMKSENGTLRSRMTELESELEAAKASADFDPDGDTDNGADKKGPKLSESAIADYAKAAKVSVPEMRKKLGMDKK